jgi:hypothetical protein
MKTMKKINSILAFALVLALMLSLSVSAFAANTKKSTAKADADEVTELNWEDFEEALEESELEGDFYTLNAVSAQFWVPSFFVQTELTDEDAEEGLIAYFDDGSEDSDYGFFVTYFDLEGATLEEYAEEIAEDKDYHDLEVLKINGLDAIGYTEDDKEMGVVFEYVSFVTDDGYLLTFTYWDFADEDYQALVAIMVASIMPEETE